MRSIRLRLALLFFAILLTALAFVYLFVVPQLESSLRNEKLQTLDRASRRFAPALADTIGSSQNDAEVTALVRSLSDRSTFRVTLLNVARADIPQFPVVADSLSGGADPGLQFPAAEAAKRTRRPALATEPTNSGRVAEVGRLLRRGEAERVVVFSTPLADVVANVALIRRRVLIAGAIALLFGVLAGLWVAEALARRVKRLERAAERVAAGDLSGSIEVDGEDELGQLAGAFNEMQRQLAQLDSARKRFIATASHELRTPIFSLGGFIELLSDEDIEEHEREAFVAQMREQVERLRTLATELLDLSKLEAGSLELHTEPVDLAALTQAVTREFTPALTRHGSDLRLRLRDEEGLEATCDPDRVAQIVRILLDNALTHTPPGTDIVVSAARDRGRVHVAVRDFGDGIPRASVSRVFEPFFTSDGVRGSGLGLAIASELAERMEGSLAVDSSPGRTVFTLEIPA